MSSSPGRGPAISAHRGGSEHGPGGTYEAYQHALAIGADYVEFDVRQTRDGVPVAWHAERVRWGLRGQLVAAVSYSRLCELAGFEVPRVAELMRLLAGRARAHVDLKDTGSATTVTRLGLEVLGPTGMLVTAGDCGALAAVKRECPAVPTGLTIGSGGLGRALRLPAHPARAPALSRVDLARAGMPDWAVIHRRLARAEVLARYQLPRRSMQRQREQLPVLVMQVNPVFAPVLAVDNELEVTPVKGWNGCVTWTRRYRSCGSGVVDDVGQRHCRKVDCQRPP